MLRNIGCWFSRRFLNFNYRCHSGCSFRFGRQFSFHRFELIRWFFRFRGINHRSRFRLYFLLVFIFCRSSRSWLGFRFNMSCRWKRYLLFGSFRIGRFLTVNRTAGVFWIGRTGFTARTWRTTRRRARARRWSRFWTSSLRWMENKIT